MQKDLNDRTTETTFRLLVDFERAVRNSIREHEKLAATAPASAAKKKVALSSISKSSHELPTLKQVERQLSSWKKSVAEQPMSGLKFHITSNTSASNIIASGDNDKENAGRRQMPSPSSSVTPRSPLSPTPVDLQVEKYTQNGDVVSISTRLRNGIAKAVSEGSPIGNLVRVAKAAAARSSTSPPSSPEEVENCEC